MGSQWGEGKIGEMCSCVHIPVKRNAAAFSIVSYTGFEVALCVCHKTDPNKYMSHNSPRVVSGSSKALWVRGKRLQRTPKRQTHVVDLLHKKEGFDLRK